MVSYQRTERLVVAAGQSEVWRATRLGTGEQVIMKRLLPVPQMQDNSVERQRFRREVRCQSTLRHPNIMPILGHNFSADPPWYVMPVASRSLQDDLDSPWPLTESEVQDVFTQVLEGVEFAHSEGVYHRDLKPANVLRLGDRWVVADFGMARDINSDSATITKSNTVIGTIAYMAPEQFDAGHRSGPEADVFSLGRMLYHCLVGEVPFPYVRLDRVPAKYRYLVTRCLAEEPEDRYPSVSELKREFEMLAGQSDTLTAPGTVAQACVARVLEGDAPAAGRLLEVLLEHAEDEVFYKEFVPRMPRPVLAVLMRKDQTATVEVLKAFDKVSAGSHPLSYTDAIANFLKDVFELVPLPEVRRMALRRILRVGHEHNRYYVRSVFCRLLAGLENPEDVLMAAGLLRENPDAAAFVGEAPGDHSYPREIRQALRLAG